MRDGHKFLIACAILLALALAVGSCSKIMCSADERRDGRCKLLEGIK